MPLSVFIDALPYNEITANYSDWFDNMKISELLPNIAYSSSLHWQLYCDKYPDQRGVLVDWVKEPEKNKAIRLISSLLVPLDCIGNLGLVSKKVLNRYIFRRNAFANIPYKFRKEFTEKGRYLFWSKKTYSNEEIFNGYTVISQDEGHKSFELTLSELDATVKKGEKNIFAVFGFADALGHKCRRGELYSGRLKPYMDTLKSVLDSYREKNPNEEILIVSDHGMSTVKHKIDLELEKRFGKQSKKTYIAYCDTAVMCIWCENDELKEKITDYLATRDEGHLLNDTDREYFKATDKKFGDIIYIMREGNVFADNWFGKSIKRPNPDGSGMHGFWPEREAKDQMACIILISSDRILPEKTDYSDAYKLINEVMKGS